MTHKLGLLILLLVLSPAFVQAQRLSNVIDFRELSTVDCFELPSGPVFNATCIDSEFDGDDVLVGQNSVISASGISGSGFSENAADNFAVSRLAINFDLDVATTYTLDIEQSANSASSSQFFYNGPELDLRVNQNNGPNVTFDELPTSGVLAPGSYIFSFDNSTDLRSDYSVNLTINVVPEPSSVFSDFSCWPIAAKPIG